MAWSALAGRKCALDPASSPNRGIMGAPSFRLSRVGRGMFSGNDEVFLSRFKLALGLVLIVGAAILIAVMFSNPSAPSRAVSEPDRTAAKRGRADKGTGSRDTTSAGKSAGSDAVLNSLIKRPSESDPYDSNGPRMQRKQIKMH
jgi:hypothetical protein